jgi:hypothetical protein
MRHARQASMEHLGSQRTREFTTTHAAGTPPSLPPLGQLVAYSGFAPAPPSARNAIHVARA